MTPKIIAISGITGAGKSTLVHELSQKLSMTSISWDDFDEISQAPDDYVQWYHSGQDYNEWKYDALAEVLRALKSGKEVMCPATHRKLLPTPMIIFDAPLGRKHPATGQYIDFAIFLDTPLDIAMARRLLRDFRDKKNFNCEEIFAELNFYLNDSRPLYTMAYEDKSQYDFILEGGLPLAEQLDIVVKAIT